MKINGYGIRLTLATLLLVVASSSAIAQSQLEGPWSSTISLTPDFPATPEALRLLVEISSPCVFVQLNDVKHEPEKSIVHVSIEIYPADFGTCAVPSRYEFSLGQFESSGQYAVMVYRETHWYGTLGADYFQAGRLMGVLDATVSGSDAHQVPVMSGYMLMALSFVLALVGLRQRRTGSNHR